MQTALLGLGELVVTVLLAHYWLGEHLSPIQWMGAGILVASLLLVGIDRLPPEKRHKSGWLAWVNPLQINPTDIAWRS